MDFRYKKIQFSAISFQILFSLRSTWKICDLNQYRTKYLRNDFSVGGEEKEID